MFQPETEDMLPRLAPKPSIPIGATPAVQPTVPEVSILFGTQTPSYTATTTQPQEKPTYAAWKRQVLPRVTFPPMGSEVTGIMSRESNIATQNGSSASAATVNADYHTSARSNLYPMRTATVAISPLVTTPTMATTVGFKGNNNNNNIDNQANAYRRNLESAPIYSSPPSQAPAVQKEVVGLNGGGFYQPLLQRRSLDNMQSPQCHSPIASLGTANDVLTICASTQTDASLTPPTTTKTVETMSQSLRHLATKQDLEQVFLMLQQMREDQLRLMQICEVLLMEKQQQQTGFGRESKCFKEVGVQCSNIITNNVKPARQTLQRHMPIMHDYIEEEENNNENVQHPQANNYCNQLQQEIATQQHLQQYQSPRIPPIAQSTAYRANTPRATTTAAPPPPPQAQLPKPTTEKSMVMNELALKYLPNEKLDELLQDLNISPRTRAIQSSEQNTDMPLRNIENFERNPNDISNASYKYLKKYRLLPEEHSGGTDAAYQEQRQQPQAAEYAMNLQQQQQQQFAPYQRVATPLNGSGTPNSRAHGEILDLEHIRRQPKFL